MCAGNYLNWIFTMGSIQKDRAYLKSGMIYFS